MRPQKPRWPDKGPLGSRALRRRRQCNRRGPLGTWGNRILRGHEGRLRPVGTTGAVPIIDATRRARTAVCAVTIRHGVGCVRVAAQAAIIIPLAVILFRRLRRVWIANRVVAVWATRRAIGIANTVGSIRATRAVRIGQTVRGVRVDLRVGRGRGDPKNRGYRK